MFIAIVYSILFVIFGLYINEKRVQFLFLCRGFNDYSDDKFNVSGFSSYLKKLNIFLGISMSLLFFAIYHWYEVVYAYLSLLIYPIFVYIFLMIKQPSFYYVKPKKYEKEDWIYAPYIGIFSIVGVFILLYVGTRNSELEVENDKIKITGIYETELNTNEIQSVSLVCQLPKIVERTNGFAFQGVLKGYFKTENGERVKLFINEEDKPPFILIITKNGQKIYFSSDDKSDLELYKELKEKLNL
ncbi:hypothetical protein EDM00_06340 [Ornithobacterium rhinotracheale]|uniref:hypothetical protein n=1 Tax=Ornithobacterium rhinotracheale TaxID=28251 RepID=UPI00129C8B15|nr:hypothetical protein [Ornithobacterium rhinotracheale]MRI63607.1 hypothetical protein [Ornithobacterium rhinotracheale]